MPLDSRRIFSEVSWRPVLRERPTLSANGEALCCPPGIDGGVEGEQACLKAIVNGLRSSGDLQLDDCIKLPADLDGRRHFHLCSTCTHLKSGDRMLRICRLIAQRLVAGVNNLLRLVIARFRAMRWFPPNEAV
ncbi:MAG: hypothetical protein U1F83_00595 [Verrucomicrobiota bacterium]